MYHNWKAVNRRERRLIQMCTSLKVKVELVVNGYVVENATCKDDNDADVWMSAKLREWKRHTPSAIVKFTIL